MAGRELRAAMPVVLSLLGGVALVVRMILYRLPLQTALLHLLPTAPAFAFLAVLQFVMSQISKEKAARTLLFLRGLPVSNDEIITSKIVAILAGASIVFVLPVAILLVAMRHWHINQPFNMLLVGVWLWVFLLFFGLLATWAAIEFTQANAARVAGGITLGLILLFYIMRHFDLGLSREWLSAWGFIPAAGLLLVGWRIILIRFRSREFADLIE